MDINELDTEEPRAMKPPNIYTALVAEGFTPRQALQVIAASAWAAMPRFGALFWAGLVLYVAGMAALLFDPSDRMLTAAVVAVVVGLSAAIFAADGCPSVEQ